MKKQGDRGPDKRKRKCRIYTPTVLIQISVPQEIADWIRYYGKPSKRIIELVRRQLDVER